MIAATADEQTEEDRNGRMLSPMTLTRVVLFSLPDTASFDEHV